MNKRERVKIMLIHYFRISNRGNRWDSDNDSEINELVDLLIDAAKEEIQAENEEENKKHEVWQINGEDLELSWEELKKKYNL